ncbi:MAG: hypothetical protein WC806_02385 [Candidatus Gracilibacteria bacterium]
MPTLESLQKEIDQIKKRNSRVELDKAWEVSWTRRILILVLTYIVIVLFFVFVHLPNPFLNAIVPTLGFMLSTMSVPVVKKWWMRKK